MCPCLPRRLSAPRRRWSMPVAGRSRADRSGDLLRALDPQDLGHRGTADLELARVGLAWYRALRCSSCPGSARADGPPCWRGWRSLPREHLDRRSRSTRTTPRLALPRRRRGVRWTPQAPPCQARFEATIGAIRCEPQRSCSLAASAASGDVLLVGGDRLVLDAVVGGGARRPRSAATARAPSRRPAPASSPSIEARSRRRRSEPAAAACDGDGDVPSGSRTAGAPAGRRSLTSSVTLEARSRRTTPRRPGNAIGGGQGAACAPRRSSIAPSRPTHGGGPVGGDRVPTGRWPAPSLRGAAFRAPHGRCSPSRRCAGNRGHSSTREATPDHDNTRCARSEKKRVA